MSRVPQSPAPEVSSWLVILGSSSPSVLRTTCSDGRTRQ
jgi:hypothetical protein